MSETLKDEIKAQAFELGFVDFKISPAKLPDFYGQRLRAYVEKGYHGDMAWLENRIEQRVSPDQLWSETKSVIILGINYGVADVDHLIALTQQKEQGITSLYAARKDYHDVVKKKLKSLGRWLVEKTGAEIKVFVDTAPVLEKALAEHGGLGWQGKHSNLVHKDYGSWLLLGFIFTDLELPVDQPHKNHCGSCSACLKACPTDAFPQPYQLDARRCIAYLTIESKEQIPVEFRKAIGNRIFGCDDCLAACPWNKFASDSQLTKMSLKPDLLAKPLSDWLALDEAQFREIFAGTPIKRTGYERFMRNVLVASGNAPKDEKLKQAVSKYSNHESPLIKEMAAWALGEMGNGGFR